MTAPTGRTFRALIASLAVVLALVAGATSAAAQAARTPAPSAVSIRLPGIACRTSSATSHMR